MQRAQETTLTLIKEQTVQACHNMLNPIYQFKSAFIGLTINPLYALYKHCHAAETEY